MKKRQYARKPAPDTSVMSAGNLLQTRPFQADNNNQQAPQVQKESEALTGGFDLTKQYLFNPPTTVSGQPLQAKLTIGQPNDKYEQEADRVAHNVVQQINSAQTAAASPQTLAQRQEETIQMKPLLQKKKVLEGGEASSDLEYSINQARGSGQPLDANLQRQMGQAMGADFSGVKVHTDSRADQLNQSIQAKAFTTGQDLFFRQGAYQPGSKGGQKLIAHELTHVVQQGSDVIQHSNIAPDNHAVINHSEMSLPTVQRVYAPAKITAGKDIRLHKYETGTKAYFWSPRVGNQTTKIKSNGLETLHDNDVIEADLADTFTRTASSCFDTDTDFVKARSAAGNVGYIKRNYLSMMDRVGTTNFYAVNTRPRQFRFYDYTHQVFWGDEYADVFKTEAIQILNHVLTSENTTGIEIAKKDELIENIIHTASLGASPIDPNMWGTAVGNIQGKIIPRLQAENNNLINAGLITANHTLKKVEFTGADFHKHGQMPVFCIYDTDGVVNPPDPRKIVYKPGNLAVDRALYNRNNSLASALDPTGDQIPTYTLIDGVDGRLGQNNEHFTLMEFVKSDVPANTNDLLGVWASIGANAAMAYVVGLEDLHNENILLLKDRVQVIDMEATTGRFTTFSAMLWPKAINEGIGPKLKNAARERKLTSGTTQQECTGAALDAFTDTLDTYQSEDFDVDYINFRDTLTDTKTRLVPIATADLYKGIITARNRTDLNDWRNWLAGDGDYYVNECKGATGSSKAFILNVLRSAGTYNALVRGDVPYYSRDLGSRDIFDEEGNQINPTGCSKVARSIDREMNDRSDALREKGDGNMDQTDAYTAFRTEIIPMLVTLNNAINSEIA